MEAIVKPDNAVVTSFAKVAWDNFENIMHAKVHMQRAVDTKTTWAGLLYRSLENVETRANNPIATNDAG